MHLTATSTHFFSSITSQAHLEDCEKLLLNSWCPSVCLSILPPTTNQISPDIFLWNAIFKYFSKSCWENWSFIKIW